MRIDRLLEPRSQDTNGNENEETRDYDLHFFSARSAFVCPTPRYKSSLRSMFFILFLSFLFSCCFVWLVWFVVKDLWDSHLDLGSATQRETTNHTNHTNQHEQKHAKISCASSFSCGQCDAILAFVGLDNVRSLFKRKPIDRFEGADPDNLCWLLDSQFRHAALR